MRKLRGDRRLLPFLPLWMEHAVRFFFVGVVNTLVGYALYVFFVVMGLSPPLALFCGNVISVSFSFFSTGHFVYGKLGWRAIARYIVMWLTLYSFNVVMLELMFHYGWGKLLSQALLLPLMATLSFLIGRFWVFKAHRRDPV